MKPRCSAGWRRARVLAGLGVFFFTLGLCAAPLTWFPGPSLDWPLSGGATTVSPNLGNILIGGDFSYYPESLAVTNLYWMPLPAMYSVNIAPGAVMNGDMIVVYGGTDGTASTSAAFGYSPSGDMPTSFASMSVARSYLGYAPDRSGQPYAIGGLDDTGQSLASAERYNPDSNTWSPIAGLPGPRYNFPAVFDGTNSIYIFGGYTDTTSGIESASVLCYWVSKNAWTNLPSLPVAVAGSAAAQGADGNIYVVGGLSGGMATNVVQVYDATSNRWSISTPLPEAVNAAAMGVDSLGRLIFMGGMVNTSNDVSQVWRSQQLGLPDTAPVFTSYPGTNATYLVPYSSSSAATGNPQPVYLRVSGPTNLTVDYFSGAIGWTPQGLDQIGAVPVTIRATNSAGAVDWNFTINVPNPPPALPTNIHVVSATEYSVTLAWDPESPVAGAVAYGIFIPHPWHSPRGSGGGVNYKLIAYTTNTTVTITGLTPNTTYGYAINATGPGGKSGYAGVSTATIGPQPPTNLRVAGIASTSVTLVWDPSPGPVPIARYEVVGWVGGLLPTIGYGSNYVAATATPTGLIPGTYEEYAVRGYDAAGNVSGFSAGVFAVNPVAAPARVSSAGPVGGGFQFAVSEGGNSPQTALIEATTNLADPASWVQIGSILPTSNSFTFTDTNAAQYPARFYRIATP